MVIDKPPKDAFSKTAGWSGAFAVRAERSDFPRKLRLLHKTSWKEGLCGRQSSAKKAQPAGFEARSKPRRPRFESQITPAAVIPARSPADPGGLLSA